MPMLHLWYLAQDPRIQMAVWMGLLILTFLFCSDPSNVVAKHLWQKICDGGRIFHSLTINVIEITSVNWNTKLHSKWNYKLPKASLSALCSLGQYIGQALATALKIIGCVHILISHMLPKPWLNCKQLSQQWALSFLLSILCPFSEQLE